MFHYFPKRTSYNSKQIAAGITAIGIIYFLMSDKAPFSNRRRLIIVPQSVEQYSGQTTYLNIMRENSSAILHPNSPYHLKVKDIASKLLLSNKNLLPEVDWQVHVINSNELNAFVLPNGKIFVFKGLFNLVSSDAELSAVIAHEIGHTVARHSSETMSFMNILTAATVFLGFHNIFRMVGIDDLLSSRYSRTLEYEADEIGLHLMSNACYNPNAAVRIWQKFDEIDHGHGNIEFLSTHPTHKNRQDRIKRIIPSLGDWKKKCSSKWWSYE